MNMTKPRARSKIKYEVREKVKDFEYQARKNISIGIDPYYT